MKKTDNPINLIVGAGLTGLTSAYSLTKAGEDCLLCEAEDEVGGLSRSYILDGIPFDFGPHVFFGSPDPDVNSFTSELFKNEDIISRPYYFAIHAGERYWKFPVSPIEALKYPWKYKKELIKIFLDRRNKNSPLSESLQSFITKKSGPLLYQVLFEDLIEKKTLLAGDELHHDWWLRKERDIHNQIVPFASTIKISQRIERLKRNLFPRYFYPPKGYGRIPEIILRKYEMLGGKTLLNCGPIELEKNGNRICRARVNGIWYKVKNVIWTGSINSLNQIMQADLPKLPYVKMIIACLTFEKKEYKPRPYLYTYHPDPDIIFNRMYYTANIYKNLHADREGLCFELNITDKIENLSEDRIVKKILEGVEKLGFYKPEALRCKRLFYLKNSLPVYNLNYKDELKAVYSEVSKINNLFAVGRTGGYFFCLSPSAINQGLKISKHLLDR